MTAFLICATFRQALAYAHTNKWTRKRYGVFEYGNEDIEVATFEDKLRGLRGNKVYLGYGWEKVTTLEYLNSREFDVQTKGTST